MLMHYSAAILIFNHYNQRINYVQSKPRNKIYMYMIDKECIANNARRKNAEIKLIINKQKLT